jgi:uncharacterized membrane protein YccC
MTLAARERKDVSRREQAVARGGDRDAGHASPPALPPARDARDLPKPAPQASAKPEQRPVYRGLIAADAEAALFSLKSFAAAMGAYYIALSVGLAQPVWAVTTVYILSQPLAGAVLSKAFFRVLGTVLGAAAAVLFLPAFVNEPAVLSVVLALWLGLCIYLSQLDRTPRSYVFLLAGYTASIIGFPSVLAPGSIFDVAVLRVQEIGIGIAAATLVHGAVFPRSVTDRLRQQITAILGSAEQGSRLALAGTRDPKLDRERRQLASAITGIGQLAFHVAFDTARLLPRAALIRALQDQLCWLPPLTAAIEDRIAECTAREGGLPSDIAALVAQVESWLVHDIAGPARDATARLLVAEAERLEAVFDAEATWRWREILLVSLLARLSELVLVHRLLRELYDHLAGASIRSLSPEAARLIGSATGRSFHRDRGLALRTALGAVVAVSGVCAFWIATAWPSGAVAALIVGVGCALFGALPQAGIAIRLFFVGALVGIMAAAFFGFAIFPRVTDFVMLAAFMALPLLIFGSMMVRPLLAAIGLGGVLGFVNTVGLASTYQSSFTAFINGALATIAGVAAATFFIDMFCVIGAEIAFARLFRAGFRDIAARADGKARDAGLWTARMIDRIALVAARAGPTGVHPALPPYDALVGLRVGYLAGELRALCSTLAEGGERRAVDAALSGISFHFRAIGPTKRVKMGDAVLRAIDCAITAFATDRQPERRRRSAILLLTGLRRTLFPEAEAFGGGPA